nr:cell division protein FtsK [Fructobacillus broussonetiae]
MKPTSNEAKKIVKKINACFSDKNLIDVLGFSNKTRYGYEMPSVYVYLDESLSTGFVAIENIANFDQLDKEKYEQKVSGIFNGKLKKYAVVSSELSPDDSYMLFNFEDVNMSHRLIIKDDQSISQFASADKHCLRIATDLIWHADVTAHLSLIARTRSGKSVFAGGYLAPLMIEQGWQVEYNSAKFDRYVKKFNGVSDIAKIVERAEYWVSVMEERLDQINQANKDKYLEMPNMFDVGLFFDELGNLNAGLEIEKKLQKRWQSAINKLTATGASTGIHVIAISQFATKEGFLPSLARVNCSDAVIMLGGAANSATERQYLVPGFEMPVREFSKGQGLAKIAGSGHKWESLHFFETPWFS